ncbi:MAG TPA: HEAT repeat domain-containing protein [Gemmatimonadaceae bacterium]|nr:HEAT repeat domain-containing protein [Gemmatimonadaceae bacterium]
MSHTRLASLALALTLAPALGAQPGTSIARRVAAAPDGEVRLTYATRPDVCGDGRDGVSIRRSMFFSDRVESYGTVSGMRCIDGPARVTITVRDRKVTGVRTRVGGSWASGAGDVTDLGPVSAPEAAAYFISLVPQLEGTSRHNPMLAAAVADSANVAPEMLRLARTTSLSRDTRRRAVHWAGALGDASMVAPITELARASGGDRTSADDPGPGDGLEGAAAGALAMIPDDAGVPALMTLARTGSPSVRKAAVFWLGQRDDERSRAVVRTVAGDERETDAVRRAAIFALSQGDRDSPADFAFLRSLFDGESSDKLKEQVLFSVSQRESSDGTRWLLDKARDERQPMEVRRKAVFWAGQGHASVADISALYASARDERLKEHIIFVLSQQREEAATTKLISIAKEDPDREMRKKALFWLAQKDDPRITKLITDLVVR